MEERGRLARHNVIAAFSDMEGARKAIHALEKEGIDGMHISLLGRSARHAAEETEISARDSRAVGEIARNVVMGGMAGSAAGAVFGVLISALVFGGAGMAAALIGGVLAFGAIGAVAAGVRAAPLDEVWELTFDEPVDGQAFVGVHADERRIVDHAADVLRGLGPVDIKQVDARGRAA